MILARKLSRILIQVNLVFLVKCVRFSDSLVSLPKCSQVTFDNQSPCIYDGPEQKKLFPLISLVPNDQEDEEGERGQSRGDMNEENWNEAEKGHIHYMYRNQGPSGSLGVNELSQPSPTHSSYCRKSEDSKRVEESLLKSLSFLKHPFNGNSEEREVSSHTVKRCIPVPHLKHIQYSLGIKIGTPPQEIRPIIDTGSTNTWVVSKGCRSETCKEVNSFDSTRSSTFDSLAKEGGNIKIKFGTGVIKGVLASDNIGIGNEVVENQVFGMVNEEISDPKRNVFKASQPMVINFQGIIGLGFPKLAFDHHTSLYDNYSKKIGANLTFSIYFSNDEKFSSLMLGGVDRRFFKGEILMLPVVREYYWETRLKEVWVGDTKLCCEEESYVIFDSGTSFNTMPHDEFMKLKKLVSPKTCSDPVSEDDLREFPTIRYVFEGGVELSIPPREYVFLHKNKCRVAYMQIDVPSSYGRAFILGTHAFMLNYYTVYQRSNGSSPSMVGFARSIPSQQLDSGLRSFLDPESTHSLHKF